MWHALFKNITNEDCLTFQLHNYLIKTKLNLHNIKSDDTVELRCIIKLTVLWFPEDLTHLQQKFWKLKIFIFWKKGMLCHTWRTSYTPNHIWENNYYLCVIHNSWICRITALDIRIILSQRGLPTDRVHYTYVCPGHKNKMLWSTVCMQLYNTKLS